MCTTWWPAVLPTLADPDPDVPGRSDLEQSLVGTDFLQRDSFGGRLSRVGSGVSALGSAVPSEADMVRGQG